jgi:diaminopimelate decarboxylase
MKMSGGPKQFGIDAEALPPVLAEVGRLGLGFEGFHLYVGSQNLKAVSICEAQQKCYELALSLAQHAPSAVRFLNLGGSFGIPYFPGETSLPICRLSASAPRKSCRRPSWSLNWGATWWARLGSMWCACWIARFREARSSW